MSRRAATLLLLGAAMDLRGLMEWPPAGVLVGEVLTLATAPRDFGGLSERDAGRLRTWARRWAEVHPDVRAFYERHAGHEVVGAALWSILDARARPKDERYGAIVQLWRETYGYDPLMSLCPRIV